ncbi:hypothetical protein EV426DRAFT_591265 [Tirmania nivea]|nr:hypothetical protein EV426DRAFT_591265 [Tirmania nivea]
MDLGVLDIDLLPGFPQTISHFSEPTAVAGDATPETASASQILPENLVQNSVSLPTIQTPWPQVLDSNQFRLQQNSLEQYKPCSDCPQLWLSHCECIFASCNVSHDFKENDLLHRSFQDLKRHIQEHWIGSGISCSVCQNHFFYHLLNLQLLSKANAEDLRHSQIRMDFRQDVITFRNHVRENHRGS